GAWCFVQPAVDASRQVSVRIASSFLRRHLSERKPIYRHSRESGNLEMKSSRNLSEMTEIQRTGFPLLRE
ncbi:hypothetical protein EEH00_12310, partial [Neisseria gonorrhoeae]